LVERLNSRHNSKQYKKNGSKWSRNDESAQEQEEEEEERKEHIKKHKSNFSFESRRTQEGFETSFPTQKLGSYTNSRIYGPFSHKQLRGEGNPHKDEGKCKWRR
jgi:hypothetical protein